MQMTTEAPWRSKERLMESYVNSNSTIDEVAGDWDCSTSTINNWMNEFGLSKGPNPVDGIDEDELRKMYREKMMSMGEIAEKKGCSPGKVQYWMDEYDIERYSSRERASHRPAHFRTLKAGYEASKCQLDGGGQVLIHRLVAVAEHGFDAVIDSEVHHLNGIPWDNRSDNLIPVTGDIHRAITALENCSNDELEVVAEYIDNLTYDSYENGGK